jgi:5'-methylthioadenosine phosphorylase
MFDAEVNQTKKRKYRALRIGIIGGSGFYRFLEEGEELVVETPFGTAPKIKRGRIDGVEVFFLQRHGAPNHSKMGHTVPPHNINFKANIYALHELGVTRILTSSAVGIVNDRHGMIKPGYVILPHQFIDFTAPITFYEGNFAVKTASGRVGQGVVHVDMTNPLCPELRSAFTQAWRALGDHTSLIPEATYARLPGPRFETAAEIEALRALGTTIVGMTMTKEAILARELEMCYATACIATNYAAGLQAKITHEEVVTLFNQQIATIKDFFRYAIGKIPAERNCDCARALEGAA